MEDMLKALQERHEELREGLKEVQEHAVQSRD
jgi:hypothetical protein